MVTMVSERQATRSSSRHRPERKNFPGVERQDHPRIIELESKDVPDVERRDHPRIIELESKDVPGVERRDRPRIIGSRAKNLLTSSAGIGLASSAREQRIS
ncbi:hypothetical protein TKK_0002508 [Trichogramma kaykai]